jgi:hypothetical protein
MSTRLDRRQTLNLIAATALLTAYRPRPVLAAPPDLRIPDLYGARMAFSDQAKTLTGKEISLAGFMAPPLKPDVKFFVLTRMPMAICPFCDSTADWPRDIVLIKTRSEIDWVYFNVPIKVTGVLELGTEVDEETGFVSEVRLVKAEARTV